LKLAVSIESFILIEVKSISTNPENLIAINTLAGMGILTGDENLIDAALSEVVVLPIDQRQELDANREVDYLLVQHQLSQVRLIVRVPTSCCVDFL
jgi:superkiller protein 3